MEGRFEKVEDSIKKLDSLIRSEKLEDLYKTETNINNMRSILTQIDKEVIIYDKNIIYQLKEIERDLLNQSQDDQLRLEKKVKSFRSDYEIRKKKVNTIDENFTKKGNIEKYKAGELRGVDARTAERDMIKELHKETDIQGDIIDDIHKDMRDAHGNLIEVSKEVKNQGDQIQRIHEGIIVATTNVQKADKNITEMTRRSFCVKLLMHIIIVLLLIGIIACLSIKLYYYTHRK